MDRRVESLLPTLRSFGLDGGSIEEVREHFAQAAQALPPPPGVEISFRTVGAHSAAFVAAAGTTPRRRILYLHGGAFCFGSIRYQVGVPARLAVATGCEVVAPEIPLAPEHACPAATDAAVQVYGELLGDDLPIAAIGGDSSGGALALLTAVAIRDLDMSMPSVLFAFSPWTELSLSSTRFADPSFDDAVLPRSLLLMASGAFLGHLAPSDALATPLSADLRGLPPTLIHTGTDEILLGDTLALTDRLARAGVDVTTHLWPDMIHVFVAYPQLHPESDNALAEVADFIDRHSAGPTHRSS